MRRNFISATLFFSFCLASSWASETHARHRRHFHRDENRSLAHHAPKSRTRRVFRLLEATPVSEKQPYGFERAPLRFVIEKPEGKTFWSPLLTAENWNDFWFEWASWRLASPPSKGDPWDISKTKVETIEALGELRVPSTFQLILDALTDRLGLVEIRKAAIGSIKRWGGLVSARILAEQLKIERNPEIKLALHDALSEMGGRPSGKRPSVINAPDGGSYLQWQ